jgi:transposase
VIGPSGTVRVMVATKPVDFRKGMEGLAMLVREHMRADPFSGAVCIASSLAFLMRLRLLSPRPSSSGTVRASV